MPRRLPLLVLHGGPGVPYRSLEPLEELAAMGRPVIFYDQLGCGNSAAPPDPTRWTVELFREEIDAVRSALDLARGLIFGHSWGGMLAMEYALTHPAGLGGLVLSDTHASTAEYESEQRRVRSELPDEIRAVLDRHEAAGTTTEPEYQEAIAAFQKRHMLGTEQAPSYLAEAMQDRSAHPEVAQTLMGRLRDWDITARLGEIEVPTLVVVGRYGIVTPALSETLHRGIPRSRLVVFEQSAHFPYITETAPYLQTVERFLEEVEQGLEPAP
jgi:proline-specific peptidase